MIFSSSSQALPLQVKWFCCCAQTIFSSSVHCILIGVAASVVDQECLSLVWIFPSRIRLQIFSILDPGSATKNLSILTQKIVSKISEIWSGSFIPDPDPDFLPTRISVFSDPDPQHCSLHSGTCTYFLWEEQHFVKIKIFLWKNHRKIRWESTWCRTADYHHHWQDVVAGSVLGLATVWLVYR